jgi:single-strand DNA-binding protein
MNGKNLVQLVGYVGQDLREAQTANGHRVAIRMATHKYFTNQAGQRTDKTTWHNVVAWDGPADYAGRNFVKGSKIMVEGQIEYANFKGENGQEQSLIYIKAHSLLNLDR